MELLGNKPRTFNQDHEMRPRRPAEIIFLPPFEEAEVDFTRLVWQWPIFLPDLFVKNYELVHLIVERQDRQDLTPRLRELIDHYRPQLAAVRRYVDHPEEILKARPIRETLSKMLPHAQIDGQRRQSIADQRNAIFDRLTIAREKLLFLSDTHVATYAEVAALKDVNKTNRLGLIIFDRHVDVYLDRSGGMPKDIGKRNFVMFLLDDGLVTAATFVGYPKDNRIRVLEKRHIPSARDFAMHVYLKLNESRASVADEGHYLVYQNGHPRFGMPNFLSEVSAQIEFLKRAGVTNVILSIDADVMMLEQYRYTATDYNPFNLVLSLGIRDFSTAQELASLKDEHILESLETLDFLRSDLRGKITQVPKISTGYGLPLAALGKAIDLVKDQTEALGMRFGVDLPSGGKFLGDITELSAPDYKGRTAKAISTLIKKVTF